MPISSSAKNIPCDALRYNWYGTCNLDISNYYSCTSAELSIMKLPLEGIYNVKMFGVTSIVVISMLYIVLLIIVCMVVLNKVYGIPVLKLHNDNSVAGWDDYVSYHYNISRIEFKWWVDHNRPRHGPIYHAMRMARAQFKYALRQCRLEERSITSTKLAYHKQSHERFWKEIRKQIKPNLHFLTVSQELLERLL